MVYYPNKVRQRNQTPTCHPDQPYQGNGLCQKCYMKQYNTAQNPNPRPYRRIPTCHPDRPHKGHGLCKSCHDKTPERAAQIKAYTQKHAKRDQLKHKYDLSLEQYNELLEKQHGVCAICQQPPRGKMKSLSVDHCHQTGKVRGLLCITCNRTIGYLDNPEWYAKAMRYLQPFVLR